METYRWKRDKPIRNGMYVYPTAGLNVVKVETDEGATGVGLAGGVQGAEEIGEAILDHFAQVVVGQDPFDTERILSQFSDSVRLNVKGKCHPGRLPC